MGICGSIDWNLAIMEASLVDVSLALSVWTINSAKYYTYFIVS